MEATQNQQEQSQQILPGPDTIDSSGSRSTAFMGTPLTIPEFENEPYPARDLLFGLFIVSVHILASFDDTY